MKSKIVILGICSLLSACGLGKGGRNHSSIEGSASANLFLSNLKPQSYSKLQLAASANSFRYLGSFDASSLPAQMRWLPTESEIGTLSVKFEEEIYSSEYEGEVKPTLHKRIEEMKTPVYQVKDEDSNQIHFAIKDDESAKKFALVEESVKVRFAPKEYCYRAHFYMKQLADKVAIFDQDAVCNPSGICPVVVRNEYTQTNVPSSYDLHTSPAQIANRCQEYQTHYSQTDIKTNRSVPKTALIQLTPSLGGVQRIQFNL